MKKRFLFLILLGCIAAVTAVIGQRFYHAPKNLPPAQSYQPVSLQPQPTPAVENPPALPDQINLAVPFTSQAPQKNWDEIHEEFCEEASVLMASHYILNKPIPNPEYAEAELFKIKAWEEQTFGYYKDTTAEETARILREYFGLPKVSVIQNPTITLIKQALAEKKLVLLPSAGRMLPNPNFKQPGPLYHMLVVKGYKTDGTIITNDPGTRNGADFIYEPDALLNAVHDWNGGDVEHGNKVMIVVG